MKGKIIRGAGFRGVLNYVLDADKQACIVGGNIVGRDAKSLAREFSHVRQLRPDCKKPVLHIALRLPAGEDVSAEQWLKITLTLFKLMRLSANRPWTLVKHLGEHVHLVTSRVDYNGKVWTGEFEALRLIEATQQIEKLFGLTVTPGLKGRDKRQTRLTSGQIKKISREAGRGEAPEIPAKVQIAERIERALTACNGTFDDFQKRLALLGVTAKLNTAKTTRHISGISFAFEGVAIKGSKIARAFTWQGLNQLLGERRMTCENRRAPQPNIQPGPRPDDRRTAHRAPAGISPGPSPSGNRLAGGSVPASPLLPLAVPGNGGDNAGTGTDLLLSLLAGAPVTAGVGAIAGPAVGAISSAPGKADALRGRDHPNFEEDDDQAPEPDGPAMSS
jgi:hypothetical protein